MDLHRFNSGTLNSCFSLVTSCFLSSVLTERACKQDNQITDLNGFIAKYIYAWTQ